MSEQYNLFPPTFLSHRPDVVRELMLREKPMLHSALVRLRGNRMEPIDKNGVLPRIADSDISFTRQMLGLTSMTRALDSTSPPEAYVFTAKSALPLKPAVKAYHAERGLPDPLLDSIPMSRANAAQISKRLFHADLLSAIDDVSTPNLRNELDRLTETVGGLGHACVVDQYVSSGSTLWISMLLLREAGVQTVSGIRGRWYLDAGAEANTGRFDDFFTEIGTEAATAHPA